MGHGPFRPGIRQEQRFGMSPTCIPQAEIGPSDQRTVAATAAWRSSPVYSIQNVCQGRFGSTLLVVGSCSRSCERYIVDEGIWNGKAERFACLGDDRQRSRDDHCPL
jgi:hypothetical protein